MPGAPRPASGHTCSTTDVFVQGRASSTSSVACCSRLTTRTCKTDDTHVQGGQGGQPAGCRARGRALPEARGQLPQGGAPAQPAAAHQRVRPL
eukprot:scaffold27216_cov65-Phaeocystis_antarctica.AAC.3